jgi:hypothetical protein
MSSLYQVIDTIEGITNSIFNGARRLVSRNQVNQLIQSLKDASSLSKLNHAHRWAYAELQKILGPRRGPNPRPEEIQIQEAYTEARKRIKNEGRRDYFKNYRRRWRFANPEKNKELNRKHNRTYREEEKLRNSPYADADDYDGNS